MPTNARHSYAEIDYWRKGQRFLPARLQLSAGREPSEEWWSWRGADLHLGRSAPADRAGSVRQVPTAEPGVLPFPAAPGGLVRRVARTDPVVREHERGCERSRICSRAV